MDRKWCLISYHTPEYIIEQKKLVRSARKYNVPIVSCLVPSRGSWVLNCAFKAHFCFNMIASLTDYDYFVYSDADSVIKKDPILFDRYVQQEVEFACHLKSGRELLSGTLFFKRGRAAQEMFVRWIRGVDMNPKKWDQKVLQDVIQGLKFKKEADLPVEYCKIYDAPDMECDPVIEHFQASRELKKIVDMKGKK